MEVLQHRRNHFADLGENIFACFGNHWRIGHNCQLRIAVKEIGLLEKQFETPCNAGRLL